MSTTVTLPAHTRRDEILHQAVSRRSRVTVTERGPDGWRLHVGVFVASPAGDSRLWVEFDELRPVPGARAAASGLTPGTEVGLTFRRGHKKCICCCEVESVQHAERGFRVGLRLPRQVQELQRRVFERTESPKDCPIAVELRRMRNGSDTSGRGEREPAIRADLIDVSAGGLRVRAKLKDPIETGAFYLCSLHSDALRIALSVEAVLRHAEAPINGLSSLGLQFIGLEASTQGYEKILELARLVKSLQRRTARPSAGEGRPRP